MKAKSTYRFTSMREPSLRELSMIMREVAVEETKANRAAEEEFFRKIAECINKKRK